MDDYLGFSEQHLSEGERRRPARDLGLHPPAECVGVTDGQHFSGDLGVDPVVKLAAILAERDRRAERSEDRKGLVQLTHLG